MQMPPLSAARCAADVPTPSRRAPGDAEMVRFKGYQGNNTVFGAILRGELPSRVLYDDAVCLAFVDIYPASTHHYLVIPKRRIYHAGYLVPSDKALVRHLLRVANLVAAANGIGGDGTVRGVTEARRRGDATLGFHRFPLLTVYHMHMHILGPMPANSWWARNVMFPQYMSRFYQTPERVLRECCGDGEIVEDFHDLVLTNKNASEQSYQSKL
jgi:histidine triad (HIT) family protein